MNEKQKVFLGYSVTVMLVVFCFNLYWDFHMRGLQYMLNGLEFNFLFSAIWGTVVGVWKALGEKQE
jgi:hypothetical protein